MSATGTASVRVWQQADGMWRWRWARLGGAGEELMSLISHMAFEEQDEAEHSARAAYPDLPVHVAPEEGRPRRRHRRTRLLVLTALTAATVGARAWGRRAHRRSSRSGR